MVNSIILCGSPHAEAAAKGLLAFLVEAQRILLFGSQTDATNTKNSNLPAVRSPKTLIEHKTPIAKSQVAENKVHRDF